ncbi:MAG TPA: citrate/2-methylcitrate synthase [Actinomycetota bacterium]|jgi:citrate synthase|nr:citrate/2-methylcitrate synthase [Actinomycetota bacterium]
MADKGLEEVIAASTRLSDVDGKAGRLWYVGFGIEDLAERSTFEEVVYLLHNLRLPTEPELDDLHERLVSEREVSTFLADLMPTLAQQTSPMSMLRTSVSAASAYDPDGWEQTPAANERKALRLIARIPTMIAMYHRLRTDQEVVLPNPKLPHAANFLWMLLGEEPDQEDAAVLDTTLILYADHTMNASTFTARVIASTLADMHSAITGAMAALKGPLHGGANEEAMKLLEEVGDPANAERVVKEKLARKERIMGFGHRVYKSGDPRAAVLRRLAKQTGERKRDPRWYEISEEIERVVGEEKGLHANVDFYAASVYHYLGIPHDLMTPVFALARTSGWTAHVREQYGDNRLIRPESEYIGPRDQVYVPIDQRG